MTVSVVVNGETRVVPDGTTVAGLAEALAVPPRGAAVARNGEVVPRSGWGRELLLEGDTLEVLVAVAGG